VLPVVALRALEHAGHSEACNNTDDSGEWTCDLGEILGASHWCPKIRLVVTKVHESASRPED